MKSLNHNKKYYKVLNLFMKYTSLFILYFICISFKSFSQNIQENHFLVDGKLYIDSLYENKNENIIFSGIHKYDSVSKPELIKKVKNWAGTKFVNLKEVLVGETEDQMVLNYITSSFFIKNMGMRSSIDWYIRLVIQFKDGKIRCSFYDDGNVMMLPTQYSSSVPARTIKLKDYFKEEENSLIAKKSFVQGMVSLRNNIINTFESINEELNKKESVKQNDW